MSKPNLALNKGLKHMAKSLGADLVGHRQLEPSVAHAYLYIKNER